MAGQLFLYPTITNEENYGLKVLNKGWSVYYHNAENELIELDYKPVELNDRINYIETDGLWDADSCDILLSNRIVLTDFRNLFGSSGIACKNAKLGVSAIWTSADSRQRSSVAGGVFNVTEEDYKTEDDLTSVEIDLDVAFPKAALKGDVNVSVVIYIAEPGIPEYDEMHLANEYGFILGTIDSFTLKLDGNGSLFPVFEVYETDKPLWYVRCDWLDPLSNAFSESVSININTAHKNYKYIDQTQKTFCKQLLIETMSAAVCCIIEEARNSAFWDQIISDESQESGSVAEAIQYFQNTLEWDLTSPLTVSESARKYFDRRMVD